MREAKTNRIVVCQRITEDDISFSCWAGHPLHRLAHWNAHSLLFPRCVLYLIIHDNICVFSSLSRPNPSRPLATPFAKLRQYFLFLFFFFIKPAFVSVVRVLSGGRVHSTHLPVTTQCPDIAGVNKKFVYPRHRHKREKNDRNFSVEREKNKCDLLHAIFQQWAEACMRLVFGSHRHHHTAPKLFRSTTADAVHHCVVYPPCSLCVCSCVFFCRLHIQKPNIF